MAKPKRKRRGGSQRRPGGRPPRGRPGAAALEPDAELEHAIEEMQRHAAEAQSPETRPGRVAALMVEDFEGLPSPVGFAQLLAEQDPERARAVAAEVARLAPASLTALTFAAEVARVVDDQAERATNLLEQAIEAEREPDGAVELARHLIAAGLALEALELIELALLDEPDDTDAQEIWAAALESIHARATAGQKLDRYERQLLERFASRESLYRLRDRLVAFVDDRPELSQHVASAMREWLEELADAGLIDPGELAEGGGELIFERYEGLMRLAIERAWLRDSEADASELWQDGPDQNEESTAPLALLAADPDTPPDIVYAANRWQDTCMYGLWQVVEPAASPGVWLTDIVTGARRYTAVPPEQLEQAGKWSVFLCALVAIDGTWRTTGAVLHMRPAEGDLAAESVHLTRIEIERSVSGKRARRSSGRPREPEPHGVLVERREPYDPLHAALISVLIADLMPTIASELWRRRKAGPTLTNTDGDRLKLITALVTVKDRAAATERLAAHPDFTTEDDGTLTWWGRELSQMERQSMLAQLRAKFGEDEPIDNPDETPRWLRGRLRAHAGGVEIEVNSEARFEALLDVLEALELEPELTRRSAIDPPMDMPPIQLGGPAPFGASQQAIDAWVEHWPDERVPAVGGHTPRAATSRERERPRLEALLREFEHDAWLLTRDGRPAPDVDRLRTELGMERWWEPARAVSR